MKEVKTYILDDDTGPALEDIEQCVNIAKSTNCVVKLEWIMKWSGHYERIIRSEDDPQDYYENHIPHIYGL